MKFTVLVAIIELAFVSAQSLEPFPYTLCSTTTCEIRNTYVTPYLPGGSLANVASSGDSLTMGPNRLYLVNPEGTAYEQIYLKNRKLTFTLDISQVPCGMNSAMYFAAMNFSSTLGYGYCDGQTTCNEFDVTEANVGGQAVTAHPCPNATQSNTQGTCSSWGCAVNDRSNTQIGPNFDGIDVTKPFVVSTSFITDDGTDSGILASVVQTYQQGTTVVTIGNITEETCLSLPAVQYGGGFTAMSAGLDEGMVFIFSLWGTANSGDMDWLDGGNTTAKCSALNSTEMQQITTFSAFSLVPISATATTTSTATSITVTSSIPATTTTALPSPLDSFPYTFCSSTGCEIRNTFVTPVQPFGSLANVFPSGNSLTMGPNRLYLVNPEGTAYEQIYLKNRQLTFTMDISQVPCGMNAAMYFSAMSFSSEPGYGYCDGQTTCNEFDVTEANVGGQAFTAHPCPNATQSNTQGSCSSWGCGINDRLDTQIGPDFNGIDVTKPFAVSTSFFTDDGTDSGILTSVVQTYQQGSNVVTIGNITESTCLSLPAVQYGGGMTAMSAGLDEGMVFIFSLWGTANSGDMDWLDGGNTTAKCSALNFTELQQTATFSAFSLGPIDTVSVPSTSTTTVSTTTTRTTTPTTITTATTAITTTATISTSFATTSTTTSLTTTIASATAISVSASYSVSIPKITTEPICTEPTTTTTMACY
ncbi:hypothetical protein HK100_009037 [Physocladia obscura]|uniref:Glucanase n=1 Tax=Physocladia obscura TaxID=109957 RepID=A0AAD5T3M3_9FUNG|nr:hypothetical protein HK100_009037 [Physocladia obscura]